MVYIKNIRWVNVFFSHCEREWILWVKLKCPSPHCMSGGGACHITSGCRDGTLQPGQPQWRVYWGPCISTPIHTTLLTG